VLLAALGIARRFVSKRRKRIEKGFG
jgi:hypothetical protein